MSKVVIERDVARASNGEAPAGSCSWTDDVVGASSEPSGSSGVDSGLLVRAGRISLIPGAGQVGNVVLWGLRALDADGHLLQPGMVIGPSELATTHSSFDPKMSHEMLLRETD